MIKENKYCPRCSKNIDCESTSVPKVTELDFDIMISILPLWKCSECNTVFYYENACIIGSLSKGAKRIPK